MELSWHRYETYRSPKGHGLRARARNRIFEAWQDASGRWRVRVSDRPQDIPDFRAWSEARAWAEKRASANPGPESNPQPVHSRVKNRDTGASCAVSPRVVNPRAHYGTRVELVDENEQVEWSGTIGEFLAVNEDIEAEEILLAMRQGYDLGFGGGAAPMMTLRAANPRRAMAKNPSKVDAHKANQLRLFIDGTILDGDEGIMQERRDLDVLATRMARAMRQVGGRSSYHLDDDIAQRHYMPMVETAYARYLRKGGTAMNKPTRQYVATELGQDLVWEIEGERKRASEARNPKNPATREEIHAAAQDVLDRYLADEFDRPDDPELGQNAVTGALRQWAHRLGVPYGDIANVYGNMARPYDVALDAIQAYMDGKIGREEIRERALRIARDRHADEGAVIDALEEFEIPMTRSNPRGKHVACGSEITAKQCRQLQHVYEGQKKRGLSDERAAKSAWGSLRRNPEFTLATAKRWLAIRNPSPTRTTMNISNPAKGVRGEADTIAGDELELWIDNTEPLYRKWQAIVKNLWRHRAKGRYDHERAVDGFMYLVDDGAKDYVKEFGGKWNEIFDAPTRRYVANEYAKSFENNHRDEIEYAPASAKQNPRGRWSDVTAIEVYDTLNDNMPIHVFVEGDAQKKYERYLAQYGSRHERYVVQALDKDGEVVIDNQGGSGGEIRSFPKRRHNPKSNPGETPFDALTPKQQAMALKSYATGLAAGAAGESLESRGPYASYANAGLNDARVAIGGARANNPTPPQQAWVVIDKGKPTGVFFAARPVALSQAKNVAVGPAGRMRNGAGLGAFLGSLSGSVIGSVFAVLGTMPTTAGMGLVLAPLSLLLSAAGGAIGGHVAAPKDRKKRGAIGGGVGGLLGPLGAALGGYLGGRKADKRRRSNPRERAITRRLTA